jgi:pyruvate formate lyase activating enzyme
MDTSLRRRPRENIAQVAKRFGCESVAFTYNDPTVFLEYAIDVAKACRAEGIRTVAVTAGYICPEPRAEFYSHIDAANVDLKAFHGELLFEGLCRASRLGAGYSGVHQDQN